MEGVRSTCPYCGVGCGVVAKPDGTIVGDPDHPANFGRLCSKGSALLETLDTEGRLITPQIGGQNASWEDALDLVAGNFQAAIAEHGPDSVAFYVSGQLLTEDYYVANKLMKGFMGSANIDSNSRLCMASSVTGHRRAFGTDTVPGTYADLDEADLIVLVGSNLAWCHPVLYQRIAVEKERRPEMRVVNIDPRKTATCDLADQHLAIAPGADVALFNGLLARIASQGAVGWEYLSHVTGFGDTLEAARGDDLSVTGIDAFYNLWIGTKKVVTIYSQGVNQSSQGTDKVNAIINCHLATGRVGKPGMGPFSVTGQPNAMGGREVGGLANLLACHLDLENETHRESVQSFWGSSRMAGAPGLKAVELFEAVASGQIKALWIMSTNPAVSLPDARAVRDAIEACPFVVVSDIMAHTDTGDLADVLLPATGWGEKSGTVTNSDRTISRQRAFLEAPGEARADWKIICDVAAKMGWGDAFAYTNPAAIFKEHAALSGKAAALGKDFNISGFADMSDDAYEAFEPTRWPHTGTRKKERFFGDGKFFTADGKGRMIPVRQASVDHEAGSLRLNTGRIRDQWHTMTRTGKSAKLNQHMAEPFLEIHPEDALGSGLKTAGLASVKSDHGTAILRVLVTDRTPKGTVFVPIHWTARWASDARIDDLLGRAVDPISGQPDLKAGSVTLSPFEAVWFGFAISAHDFEPDTPYWAKAKTTNGYRAELAGTTPQVDWVAYAGSLFGLSDAEPISIADAGAGMARVVLAEDGVAKAALFVAKTPVELSRSHVLNAFEHGQIGHLLAGRAKGDQIDPGPTLCSCFNVGINTITIAIATQKLMDVEAIGAALQAGTNCGSCRPELRALLDHTQHKIAAE